MEWVSDQLELDQELVTEKTELANIQVKIVYT